MSLFGADSAARSASSASVAEMALAAGDDGVAVSIGSGLPIGGIAEGAASEGAASEGVMLAAGSLGALAIASLIGAAGADDMSALGETLVDGVGVAILPAIGSELMDAAGAAGSLGAAPNEASSFLPPILNLSNNPTARSPVYIF